MNHTFLGVSLYPNPSDSYITIEIHNTDRLPFNLLLYKENGMLVKEISNINITPYSLDVRSLSSGLYLIILERKTGNIFAAAKFVII